MRGNGRGKLKGAGGQGRTVGGDGTATCPLWQVPHHPPPLLGLLVEVSPPVARTECGGLSRAQGTLLCS